MKTKLLQVKALSANIESIGSQRVKLDSEIQAAAIQCIGQSIVHRNVTPANALFEALGKSVRRDSLVRMFEVHGNMAWIKSEKKIAFYDAGRKFTDAEVAVMGAKMWHDYIKQADPVSVLDVEKEVEKFLDRMKKAVADKGKTVENVELFDELRQVYLRYVVAHAPVSGEQPTPGTHEATAEKLAELAQHFGKPEVKVA